MTFGGPNNYSQNIERKYASNSNRIKWNGNKIARQNIET